MKTYTKKIIARLARGYCFVPDQVWLDQKAFDGKTFYAFLCDSNGATLTQGVKVRVKLRGDLYDLHGPGTGEIECRLANSGKGSESAEGRAKRNKKYYQTHKNTLKILRGKLAIQRSAS
jgi:hypothetical protein